LSQGQPRSYILQNQTVFFLNILKNISLKQYNTFGIDVRADKYLLLRNEDELLSMAQSGVFAHEHLLFLGGGSNILFLDDYKGLLIHSALRGMKIIKYNDEYVIIEVGAGENWHNFVTICLNNKYYGLENLALIPGTVGAAPVQNIGAYGIEQKDYFHSLRGFNLNTAQFEEMNIDDCKFAYRNSIFKSELKNKFVVTSVQYKLSKIDKPNLSYTALKQEADKFAIEKPDAQFVYDTVSRLRMSKLPSPDLLGNAGSFFKNPQIDKTTFDKLKKNVPGLTGYEQEDGSFKISAAWLIERCGWKGKRIGDAAVYDKHALIIVNYGNATGMDIYELSENIKRSVYNEFGINLEREVLIVGAI